MNGTEDLMIITDDGIVIRLPMEQVKMSGRNTQGVKLIRVLDDQKVATVEVVEKSEEDAVEETTDATNE